MRNRLLTLILISAFIFSFMPKGFAATDEEIQALKQQVQELLKRIEKLEGEQAQSKQEAVKAKEEVAEIKKSAAGAQASRVDLNNTLSKLKLKGRWAAGFLASGESASYPSGSFEIPEAKLQFSFQPDEINTLVMRFNLNNATSNSPLIDLLNLQSKDFLLFLKDTPFSLSTRLGRMKLGFGEESSSNNPVEGVLFSSSAAKVDVYDEGLELSGKIKLEKINLQPLGWVFSVSDGNSGVGSDSSGAKAFMGKLYYSPIKPLYLSSSYYDSGELKASDAALSIAGLVSPPSGAAEWRRKVWEVDVRYDFAKGIMPLEPIAYSDSKAIVRLSYGRFSDTDVKGTSLAAKRYGQFGFVEGTYNWTKKIYTAFRYSLMDLGSDSTATLNSVLAQKYCRYSIGLGYRFSENTIFKIGYDYNKNGGPGSIRTQDNLLSLVAATQF